MEDNESQTQANDAPAPEVNVGAGEGQSAEGNGEEQGQQLSPEEHAERSRLGRKVAKMEEQMSELISILKQQNQPAKTEVPPVPPSFAQRQQKDEEIPDIIATPEDVVKVLELREKKRNDVQKMYERDYYWQLEQEGKDNPDIHDQVIKEMLSNNEFNLKHTGHPLVDASKNYAKALKAVIRKGEATAKITPNLKGDNPQGAGLSMKTGSDTRTPNMPKLSPEAEAYLRKTGRSAEWAAKALGGDLPANITRRLSMQE